MPPKLLTKSRPTSSHSPIHGLPPSLQVPPGPPQAVHRSLLVSCSREGLIVRAANSAGGPGRKAGKGAFRIGWGVKGKVEEIKGEESVAEESTGEEEGKDLNEEEEEREEVEVEVKGLLGILRLWNAAYLLVIVDPKSIGAFPTPNHEIYSLTNVKAIHLTPHLAEKALLALRRSAKAPPPPPSSSSSQPSTDPAPDDSDLDDAARSASGVRWGEVVTPGNETGVESSSEEEDEDEEEEEEEREDGSYSSLNKSLTPEKKKKKINLNPFFKWNPFVPKPTTAVSSNLLHPTPATTTDPLALPDVLPPPSSPTPSDPPIPLVPSSLTLPVSLSTSAPPPGTSSSTANATRSHLETKILTSLITLFTSGQMFFSYNHDITNSLAAKNQRGGVDMIPLWRRVDRRFWWNEWLGRELIDAGLHPFVLPVMQGWVQISTLHVPRAIAPPPVPPSSSTLSPPEPAASSNSSSTALIVPPEEEEETGPESSVEYETVPVEFIVISRRSRDRAGLRYQRRGLDDEGNVANFVESEMIVRAQSHVFSHVQTRGSIPLFWSQSPYSTTSNAYALKPAPVLDRPLPIARGPMAVHFDFLKEKYGDQTVINLSEATGKEALVTKGFEEVLLGLKRTDVDYQEFDFHHECKGMKFENVSILIDRLNDTFLKQSYFEAGGPDSQKLQSQNGAFRTNCIDCLDRTNVVQSALARHVLGIQLASIGLVQTADSPPSDIETVFNDVWANNGDAISRCYAGTSALKGDFTRTGKRNLQGMINDGLNSISRMYTSAFSDFFSQAVISFMLGQRSLAVFTEFVEKLQVAEPANLLRLAVVRSEAIETCSARVISEGETRQAGWTLFAPTEMGVTGGQQFEEKVLLLTAKALYVARYDYELEKVVGFTRIPLGNVVSLQKGVYILSPLQEAGQDPEENYGFKISFRGSDDETRLASYSMRNQIEPTPSTSPTKPRPKSSLRPLLLSSSPKPQPASILTNDSLDPSSDEIKFFAFKAIPRDVVLHGRELSVDREDAGGGQGDEKTCHEVVNGIVTRIRVLCSDAGSGWDGVDGLGGKFLREEAIISLAEAQSNTPFLARIEHGVKRWLWL